MSIFGPIPEEVIWEMSQLESRDDYDPEPTAYQEFLEKRTPRRKFNESQLTISCPNCGTNNLIPVITRFGERLAYNTRRPKLAGKIHACPDELQ